jgi:hypothetical protein
MKLSIATLFLIVSEVAVGRKLLDDDCTLYAVADARLPGRHLDETNPAGDLDFVCETDELGGLGTFHVALNDAQKKLFEEGMNNGNVVSGLTTLQGAYHEGDEIIMEENTVFGRKEEQPKAENKNKSILVVRVTDKDGKVIPQSAAEVGDNIFGTINDPNNLKSQMYDCSYGAVEITNEYNSPNIDDKLSAPGVLDVTIPISINGNRYTVHNAVTAAANAKLGYTLPGQHEQVMYILEKCYQGCGWAAYAYVNSWMSVYQDRYYLMTGVQMHEIGHNLGMAHSGGLNGSTYTDHTCLMGNPLYSDDVGKMCFNPAKNWYVNWYDDYKTTVDITVPNISKAVSMVGVAEIKVNNNELPAVMKLETGTSNDYFVAFNRATGINSDNDEADDEVTIVQTGNNGESYSQSYLKATLKQGESYKIGDLEITASSINTGTKPGVAVVTLKKGNQGPTKPPTGAPTPPISSFGPTPSNWKTGEPTGTNGSPTKSPSASPSDAPTAAPTPSQKCEGLGKKDCKKNDNCAFGNNKITVDCKAKKKSFEHDCSKYSVDECTSDNAQTKKLCEVKDGACTHVCDGVSNSACKKKKDAGNNKKVCTNKAKNPCKKCKPKSCEA